jgi:hypothetical protein
MSYQITVECAVLIDSYPQDQMDVVVDYIEGVYENPKSTARGTFGYGSHLMGAGSTTGFMSSFLKHSLVCGQLDSNADISTATPRTIE